MITIGETNIVKAYLGQTELKNIAIGDELLLNSEPTPMQFVSYIESTGTQYIDTLYTTGASTIITVKLQLTSWSAQKRIIGTSIGYFEVYVTNTDKYGFSSNGKTYASTTDVTTTMRVLSIDNVALKGYVEKTGTTITKNGTSYYSNVYLLGRPSASNTLCSAKLYGCTIYEGSVLVRDFVPVRVGQVGYMYDKVSGRLFGNSGTGSFGIGDDITINYDSQVEYLESTGTQYIDTGVKLNGNSICDLTLSVTTAQNNGIFGARTSYKNSDFSWHILSSNKNRRNYGTQENTSGGAISLNSILNYRAEGNVYKGNGNIAYTFTKETFETSGSAYICAINNNGEPLNPSKMRVYGCSIEGVNKSVDLFPVRVGQVGYLFDRLSGQLYGNAGTGNFILGNDINN